MAVAVAVALCAAADASAGVVVLPCGAQPRLSQSGGGGGGGEREALAQLLEQISDAAHQLGLLRDTQGTGHGAVVAARHLARLTSDVANLGVGPMARLWAPVAAPIRACLTDLPPPVLSSHR